jgi:uncharacterized repeat protein (TIGR01451 family)
VKPQFPLKQSLQKKESRQTWWKVLLPFMIFPGMVAPLATLVSAQTPPLDLPKLSNTASYSYLDSNDKNVISGPSNTLVFERVEGGLIDPLGQVLGCGGRPLDDYNGFSVALYEPDATGTDLGALLSTTRTEVPDIVGNGIPRGIAPNITNVNPFPLENASQGRYSFLLDKNRGQINVGRAYILVVTPPTSSTLFTERRIRLEITAVTQQGTLDIVSYRAVSLDGMPIAVTGATEINQTVVLVSDAEQLGLQLLAFQMTNAMCQQNQIEITKSGDRAAATVGDTVIYRLSIRNTADGNLDTLTVTDTLPIGFKFVPGSVRASFNNTSVPVNVTENGRNLTFGMPSLVLPPDGVVTLAYAAQLNSDAIRGDGQNSASVNGQREDNDTAVSDGPALHRLRISPGLLSDCGTIIGRVFEDRNFDGEQQDGEPGIPNAVVYMQDGNRITTDPNGLFNVKCVLPGYQTGVLDPLSVPGYRLAPNHKFIERNSPSRLVKLAPGGMVRMNFGVTPTGRNGEQQ